MLCCKKRYSTSNMTHTDDNTLNPDDSTGVYIVERGTQKITFLKIQNEAFLTLSELQEWSESARQAGLKRKSRNNV